MLVVSHVPPFPGLTGQQQRVFHMLRGMRERFHVSFVTTTNPLFPDLPERLPTICDEVHLLPSLYHRSLAHRVWYQTAGRVYGWSTGLKKSHYLVGKLELAPERLAQFADPQRFDLVMLEYWMATPSLSAFKARGIPCVLDMHDVLWQTYKRDLDRSSRLPAVVKSWVLNRYRRQEETAWRQFDGLIAINRAELSHVAEQVSPTTAIFHAAMGVDLSRWSRSWQPAQHQGQPVRLAYYGGFGNPANRTDAMICYEQLMPAIWQRFPDAELWLVGSNPPAAWQSLTEDNRIKVTGFVKDPQPILSTMTAVLCPFNGTFGFRSRLIEVMALGVPVVASPDAVYGMELEEGYGLLLGRTIEELIEATFRVLENPAFAAEQSLAASQQVEQRFSVQATYHRLADDLSNWLQQRRRQS